MDTDRLTRLLHTVSLTPSRRSAVRVVGGLGLAGILGNGQAKAKRKNKKKKCRRRPRPGVCAGQNQCAEAAGTSCEASGAPCQCWVRQDNATSVCGQFVGVAGTCAACATGQICVVLGGTCVAGFGCVTPCPNPR